MKQLAKSILGTALMGSVMFSAAAFAEQKIGVVNVEAIFQQMPQAATLQQGIQDEFKDQRAEMERMQSDIEYELNKRQREAATMSEAQIKELEEKILKMREEYQAKAQPLQQQIQRRVADERNKLIALIQTAIEKVAANGDFDMVLQGQAAVFAKDEFNLSEAVLKEVTKPGN